MEISLTIEEIQKMQSSCELDFIFFTSIIEETWESELKLGSTVQERKVEGL